MPVRADRLAARSARSTRRAWVLLEPDSTCDVAERARCQLPSAVQRPLRPSLGMSGANPQVQRRIAAGCSALLLGRIHPRRYVDAHGDLRPEHIWLREPVTIIDCLEFDPKLRANDPLDEIAFLHLECERLGGLWAAERIRRHLAHALGDDDASGLFLFYRSHRAMLRARLSIAHLFDTNPRTPEKWPHLARVYLDLAAADAARLERTLDGVRKMRPRAR